MDENTYIFDVESPLEMVRLINLDRFTTQAMGGPLAGLPDLSTNAYIADLACGPGGWALDVAFAYPEMEVAGIDISRTMIDYANARACSQGLTNASFGVMNITQALDFADASFDLVNVRFLVAAIPRGIWPRVLAECRRILRPGGILRLTETDDAGLTTSPAYEEFSRLAFQAMNNIGYGFSATGRTLGMTPMLPSFLQQAECDEHLTTQAHALYFSVHDRAWADLFHNTMVGITQIQPLLVRMGTPEEKVDALYQQLLVQMHAEDFRGVWQFISVWGKKR